MSDTSKLPSNHLDAWLTKFEAAQLLGCAEKTVERMATRKEVQKSIRYRRGLPPQIVFHPADLARIKEAREQPPEPFVVPANGSNTPVISAPARAQFSQSAMIDRLLAALEPYDLLTLKRAHEASGLPKKYLHAQFVKTGRAVMISRRWYIPHARLAEFCRRLSDTSDTTSDTSNKALPQPTSDTSDMSNKQRIAAT